MLHLDNVQVKNAIIGHLDDIADPSLCFFSCVDGCGFVRAPMCVQLLCSSPGKIRLGRQKKNVRRHSLVNLGKMIVLPALVQSKFEAFQNHQISSRVIFF